MHKPFKKIAHTIHAQPAQNICAKVAHTIRAQVAHAIHACMSWIPASQQCNFFTFECCLMDMQISNQYECYTPSVQMWISHQRDSFTISGRYIYNQYNCYTSSVQIGTSYQYNCNQCKYELDKAFVRICQCRKCRRHKKCLWNAKLLMLDVHSRPL